MTLGLTAGALSSARAPKYGRVALIQSAALGGAITGTLVQLGARWHPYGSSWGFSVRGVADKDASSSFGNGTYCSPSVNGQQLCPFESTSTLDLMPGALIGLNVGLAAGLLGAYLPDQSRYGPSWKRILLIDLAAAAGAVAGGVGGCVADVDGCLNKTPPSETARSSAALAAIGGTAVGIVGGILLTRHLDDDPNATPPPADKPKATITTSMFPLRAPDGSYSPGIGAFGTF